MKDERRTLSTSLPSPSPTIRHPRRFAIACTFAFITILFLSSGAVEGGDTPIMVSYGEGTVQTPRYRTWNGVDWADEVSANSGGGTVQWAVLKAHPSKAEAVLGVLDDSGHVNVQVWDGDSWGTPLEVTTAIGTTNDAYRGFDIAYEQSSGDAIIVYNINETDPEYRIWSGTSWSEPDTVECLTADAPIWIKLCPKPNSDTIMLVILDKEEDVSAAIWDGSQFGDSISLETSASYSTYELVDAAWASSSGHCLVVWGWDDGTDGYIRYNTWDGSQWGSSTDGPLIGFKNYARYLRLAAKPASDTILVAVSYDSNQSSPFRLKANLWNGSSWGTYTDIESIGMEEGDRRCHDIAFESSGSQAILGWSDAGVHTLAYRTWTSSTGWSAELTGPDVGNDIQLVQLRADPNSDEIMLGTITDDLHLELTLWTGSWGTVDEVDTSAASQQYEPYMLAHRTGAVTYSWIYPTSGSIGGIYSSPTIRGGRVYVGSDDAKLYCLDASDGSLIWTYSAGDTIRSSPSAAYESGNWVTYFGANDGYVYAVKDTGSSYEEKWTRNLGAVVGSSPGLWDSLLYIGCNDDSIHCLRTSDGSQKWATYLYGDISSSPAVHSDNVVYIGSKSDTLYALNYLDGTVLRTYGTCGDIVAPPYITYETGRLCVGSYASETAGSDTMYIMNSSNFSTYWKFADSGNLARVYTAAFSPWGIPKLYFGSDNNYLYCLDLTDSTLVYKYDTGDDVRSSPLLWHGIVYSGSNSDKFYGLDDVSQQLRTGWPFVANANIESSPAISVSLDIAIVGSSDGYIYAFNLE